MKIASCPRIFSWPTYSSSARGRSVRSSTSSCGVAGAAAIRRSVSIIGLLCLGQQLQGLLDAIGNSDAIGQMLDRMHGFLVAVAEREQRIQYVGGDRHRTVHADCGTQVGTQLVLEFE